MELSTQLVHFDPAPGDPLRPTSTPIYQTATFCQPDADGQGPYDYTRSGNPTRSVLQRQLARLEGGCAAFVFASGMAALSTLTSLLQVGDHVLAGDDLYGGSYRLLDQVARRRGLLSSAVDLTDLAAVRAGLRPSTRLLLVETPTNPLQRICDLRALAAICRERDVLLAVDNSLLSPLLQQPLLLGADLVVHSATKHLGGHSDLTAGVLAVRNPDLAERIAFLQNAEGTALGPFDSWLLLRGLKTLALRLERQQTNALRVAEFLAAHPAVRRVHYPGLSEHPGAALHRSQARGAGAVISFETGDLRWSRQVVEATSLFSIAVSFGNLSSFISLPCRMSHASIPAAVRAERALPEDLVRLSIGIEAAEDLVADLAQAFCKARAQALDPATCSLRGG